MQAHFYDASLRNRLNSNKRSYIDGNNELGLENVVLNQEFSKWENEIRFNLDPKNDIKPEYTSDADRELLKAVKQHIEVYNKPIKAENAIVLTHPFYLHLCNMNMLKTDLMKEQADDYLNKLLWLFEANLPRRKASIVVLESIHNYAAATSLLLESGMIDYAVITEAHSGAPIDEWDLFPLSGKKIFVGGSYNGRCLRRSNEYVGRKARTHEFWAIHDLIINNPLDRSKSIHPSIFSIGAGLVNNFWPHKVINLEKTLEMIGCEEYAHPN